ncbi:MAG: hypothetical protein IT262_22955, partial [Saprospiraceae bacterium]|nr:hypothetical protein [Saprospiraceae bacterium]
EIARTHQYFYFELTPGGGHCGFRAKGDKDSSWSERRALEFCEQIRDADLADHADFRG